MAEGLRHGRNTTKFPCTIDIAPTRSSFSEIVGSDVLDFPVFTNEAHNLCAWHHFVHAPAVSRTNVHVFNKARDNGGIAKAFRNTHHFLLIDATFDYGVDLDFKALFNGVIDGFEHFRGRKAHIVKGLENIFVNSVKRNRYAL